VLLSVLALSVGMASQPSSNSPTVAAAQAAGGVVVYLGCQVSNAALTDCKVVNDDPVDAEAASVALKLAQAMTLPQALAERNTGRIVVKLTVRR
jgi:hypothetical protein